MRRNITGDSLDEYRDSLLQNKFLRWLHPFITPAKMPDNIIEQQQAKQLAFYLFILVLATALNLLLWVLLGDVTTFTMTGFLASIILYGAGRLLYYKTVAIATTITALTLPLILFIFSPADLTIVALIFLLVIALLVSSQFLSLQINLQVSIVFIILIFALNTVAIPMQIYLLLFCLSP